MATSTVQSLPLGGGSRPTTLDTTSDSNRANERSLVVRSSHDNISRWYKGSDADANASRVAQEAFQRALKFFEQEMKASKKQPGVWIKDKANATDVLKVVEEAKSKYELRKSKTSKWMSKTSEILAKCSSRIVYYSGILDVLVQHHPEYVSLAWGAMKFLFVITINHEEHVVQIASALSKISSLLPQINMLSQLYPIAEMQVAVANLYAQIMRFCVKAATWYSQKGARHALNAIIKPFSLEFKDILNEIDAHAQNMRHIADIAAQAELRDLHLTVRKLEKRQIQQTFSPEPIRPQPNIPNQPNQLPTSLPQPPTLEEMKKHLISNVPNQGECYRVGNILRSRRRARGAFNPSHAWVSDILRKWASEPTSAVLEVKSSIVTKEASRDFVLDMIELAQTAKLPAVWVLNSPLESTSSTITGVDVVKSLIEQALQQHPNIQTRLPYLTKARLQSLANIEEWVNLFVEILSQIPRILIIFDTTEELALAMKQLSRFWQQLISPSTSAWVKVVIVRYEKGSNLALPSPDSAASQILDLDSGRRPGAGRNAARPFRRGPRGNTPSAEQLKPYLLKSMKGP